MFEIARVRGSGVRWVAAAALAAGAGASGQPEEQPGGQPGSQPDQPAVDLATPAAPVPEPETMPGASPFGLGATDYSLRAYSTYEDSAVVRSDPGEVSVWRAGLDFSATMPIDAKSRLRLRAGAEYANFSFQNERRLSPNGGTPVEELSSYRLGVGYERQLDEDWSVLGRVMLRDGVEGGAKVIDGIGGDLTAGVLWQQQPGIRIGLGMTAFWRVEDYTQFLPVPFVDLDMALNEHWRVVLTIPEWAGFVYKPSNVLSVKMGVGVHWQDYRLSSNNPVPEGVFREFSVPAMVEASWRFAPEWSLQAGIGTNIYQRFDLNDKEGNDVTDATTDFAPLFMLGVQWDF
jgi:hypothetical protein